VESWPRLRIYGSRLLSLGAILPRIASRRRRILGSDFEEAGFEIVDGQEGKELAYMG
jgi:hypothetical protein